jgi:hypothetical protein
MKSFDDVFALVNTWTRRIGLLALVITAMLMALKGLGVPISWRTPPLDQSTGIALAAIAYVLSR